MKGSAYLFAAPVILEEKADYMRHDRLFKKLIKEFFEAFIEGFFPDLHPYIDFSEVTFLEQEVYLDYIKGTKKEIDLLAEVTLNHQDKILHIHTEAQSSYEDNFPERMFLYFSLSSSKRQKLGGFTSRSDLAIGKPLGADRAKVALMPVVKVNIDSLPYRVSFIS